MKYIVKMLSQPSTYAGFAGIALAVGVSSDLYQHVAAAAAAAFGLLAFLLDEKRGA